MWRNLTTLLKELEACEFRPYHQSILDMADGDAESLKSVIANLAAITSKDGIDAVESYKRFYERNSKQIDAKKKNNDSVRKDGLNGNVKS